VWVRGLTWLCYNGPRGGRSSRPDVNLTRRLCYPVSLKPNSRDGTVARHAAGEEWFARLALALNCHCDGLLNAFDSRLKNANVDVAKAHDRSYHTKFNMTTMMDVIGARLTYLPASPYRAPSRKAVARSSTGSPIQIKGMARTKLVGASQAPVNLTRFGYSSVCIN